MEQNPSKGWGVFEIPRKFPFWGGEGEGKGLEQKKICFVFSGPNGNCLPIWSQSAQKSGHIDTHTDRHTDILLL